MMSPQEKRKALEECRRIEAELLRKQKHSAVFDGSQHVRLLRRRGAAVRFAPSGTKKGDLSYFFSPAVQSFWGFSGFMVFARLTFNGDEKGCVKPSAGDEGLSYASSSINCCKVL